jgi:type II secretion system protein H
MARMASPEALHWMPISINRARPEAGFTLLELLLFLALIGTVFALATLAIPNHSERYWRDNLEALRVSLNAAQDEAIFNAIPITVEIDSQGWRFYQNTRVGTLQVMRDPFAPRVWQLPVTVVPTVWQLGAEPSMQYEALEIREGGEGNPNRRQARIVRNPNAQFVVQTSPAVNP